MNYGKLALLMGVLFFALLSFMVYQACADDRIPVYDSQYGGKVVGAIGEDGTLYDQQYGGKAVGRIDDDGVVYDEQYGGKSTGRIGRDEDDYQEWREDYGYERPEEDD